MRFGSPARARLAGGALLQTPHEVLSTVTSGGVQSWVWSWVQSPGLLQDVRGTHLGSTAPCALLRPEPAARALRGWAQISHFIHPGGGAGRAVLQEWG